MRYRFLSAARVEFEEAAAFYEDRASGFGRDFVRAVESAIERICSGPETFAVFEDRFRYCPVRRFPYVVIYDCAETIEIVAVMHTSRRPGYWRDRRDDQER